MKKFPKLIFLLTLAVQCGFANLEDEWTLFKKLHRRKFTSRGEELYRKDLFLKKLQEIQEHNVKYRRGLETYTINTNQFSDYTPEERVLQVRGLRIPSEEVNPFGDTTLNSSTVYDLADAFDWRNFGAVTPVKNQNGCGACWAFSATGSLESHYKIQYGQTVTLSEQQLVDCVPEATGCGGGWMTDAYKYITMKGINYDKDYPYVAGKNFCRSFSKKPKISIKGYVYLNEGDEEMLRNVLVTRGPISVAIDGGGNFPDYSGGVYYNPTCSNKSFSHAGVIVGYGSENGEDFWWLKNSWGSGWGLKGYVKMARNRNNHCGIASRATYPIF